MSRFEVWRQDDNGNRFLMSGHAERADAEAAVAAMEAGVQHKQLYYVVARKINEHILEPAPDTGAAQEAAETA